MDENQTEQPVVTDPAATQDPTANAAAPAIDAPETQSESPAADTATEPEVTAPKATRKSKPKAIQARVLCEHLIDGQTVKPNDVVVVFSNLLTPDLDADPDAVAYALSLEGARTLDFTADAA